MSPAIQIMREAGTANILADRTTMEYILEKMSSGFPKLSKNGVGSSIKIGTESAVTITAGELCVFLTASQFSIACLTDLWDCREGVFQYGTRGKGEWNVRDPIVNLLGASAPTYLVKSIPNDAIGGGFTRRVNFVLGTSVVKKPLSKYLWEAKKDILVEDLRFIHTINGEFSLTPQVKTLFEDYTDLCDPEEFDDEASSVYKASKWTNVGKLAQVLAISRGDDLLVTEPDIQVAIDRVEEIAENVKRVFRVVGESPMVVQTEKVVKFLEGKGFATRGEILQHNWRHMTSNELDVIIVTLREAGVLIERTIGSKTEYAWRETLVQTPPQGGNP